MQIQSLQISPLQALQQSVGAGSAFTGGDALPGASEAKKASSAEAATAAYLAAQADQRAASHELTETQGQSQAERTREAFLAYAQKSPMERLRDQILESLGLTEEGLAALPPEEKAAMEDKIRKIIEEKLRESMRERGVEVDGPRGAQSAATDILA
jgi:hypothetical protein